MHQAVHKRVKSWRLGWVSFLVLAVALVVLTRCGNKTNAPASGTFAAVYQNTLSGSCAQCHKPGLQGPQAGVPFDVSTAATAYASITSPNSVQATDLRTDCAGVKMLDSTTVANSYFLAVLSDTYFKTSFAGVAACTPSQSHLGFVSLSADEITSIVTWITNGYQNN